MLCLLLLLLFYIHIYIKKKQGKALKLSGEYSKDSNPEITHTLPFLQTLPGVQSTHQ